MADVKTTEKGTNKVLAFFKALPAKLARPFKNMWSELKKVTWPTRQDLIKYSLIVLAFLVFMCVVVGLLDMGSLALINLIG